MGSPIATVRALDVIAICVLCKCGYALNCAETVIGIHNFKVSKIARLSKPFFGVIARAHLGGCVFARGPRVDHFSSPLHHGGPFDMDLPYEYGDVILASINGGYGRNGSTDCNSTICLHKSRTQKIIASGCLICIAL
nr:hypothetical protein Iba_chr01aCG14270 [Ipomoea batatas]